MAESAVALVQQLHDRLLEILAVPTIEIAHDGTIELVAPDRQLAQHLENQLHGLVVVADRIEADFAQYNARKEAADG